MAQFDIAAAYEQYAGELQAFARSRLNDEHKAEDIVQQVFVDLMRNIASYDNEQPRALVYRVANSKIIDEVRRLRRRGSQERDEAFWQTQATAEEGTANVLDRAVIEQLLARAALPGLQQHVVELRDLHGRGYDEIARDLSLTIGAVKALRHRALTRLRQIASDQPPKQPALEPSAIEQLVPETPHPNATLAPPFPAVEPAPDVVRYTALLRAAWRTVTADPAISAWLLADRLACDPREADQLLEALEQSGYIARDFRHFAWRIVVPFVEISPPSAPA